MIASSQSGRSIIEAGGRVRYVSLSPGKQALLALSAVGLAGWCVYATANTLLEGPQATASNAEIERERAKYDRWLNEFRAQAAAAQAHAGRAHPPVRPTPPATSKAATKCFAACSNMPAAPACMTASARPIERDGARIIMAASIDEAEPRQSRAIAV